MHYFAQQNAEGMLAIEKGNSDAMYNLGFYYEEIKDYDNMIKYYLIAIENDNETLFDQQLFDNIFRKCEEQDDYLNIIKIGLISFENGNFYIAHDLINHFVKKNDLENMVKLIEMALKKNYYKIFKNLIFLNKKNVSNDNKEFILKVLSIINFDNVNKNKMPSHIIVIKSLLDKQINLLETHFKYLPNGNGFNKAKKDFINLISKN